MSRSTSSRCSVCGLTDCPDDDPQGRACPIIHEGVPYRCGVCKEMRIGGDGHGHTVEEGRRFIADSRIQMTYPEEQ